MHTLLTAIAALAIASPAWAANVEADFSLARAAYDVCRTTGGDENICFMTHYPEVSALRLAQAIISGCALHQPIANFGARPSSCEEVLPYIKQRWGY